MATDDQLVATPPRGDDEGHPDDTPPEAGGLSRDDVRAVMEESFSPFAAEVGKAMRGLAERIEKVEKPNGNGGEDPAGDGAAGDGAAEGFIQELVRDPDRVIRERVAKASGPLFQTMAAERRDDHLRVAEKEIDEEFGEGTWKEMFAEKVQEVVSKWPPENQARKAAIEGVVSLLKGLHFRELAEKGATPPKAEGGYKRLPKGRATPPPAKLSEEEMAGLAKLRKAGIQMSDGEYLAMKDAGPTIEDWRAVRKMERK